ncbi:MAG TPA: hypothetical protein VK155_00355 [Bacteroidales bacterium]|jgi:hypothetical protein|nr:hypothetical protein [Bacteroidales bacterium]
MKKIILIIAAAFAAAFIISANSASAQDPSTQSSEMLDMKLQLLDSKLDLLDTKIKLWEAKPKELDNQLRELSTRMNQISFDPVEMSRKINEIDSLYKLSRKNEELFEKMASESRNQETAEVLQDFAPSYNSAIMLDPVRLLEGTFSISYERVLNPRFSANLNVMTTYSTKQGLSNLYFSNQSFAFYNSDTRSYDSYKGEVMSGAGVKLQLRNYLLAGHPGRRTSPIGLYAAPEIMYRHYTITGYSQVMEQQESGVPVLVNHRVVQNLDVVAVGAVLGYQIPLFKVLAIDIFAGGNIRLSKYLRESGFTRYKNIYNFDFSGVSPIAGVSIGILK